MILRAFPQPTWESLSATERKSPREIADITISQDNLMGIVTLRELSQKLMKRIRQNYRMIVGINTGLIGLGVTGAVQPTTSALLHNTSTLMISLQSMKNLL